MRENKSLEHRIETASKTISIEEQQKLKQKAENELLRLENVLKNDVVRKKIDSFKDKFALCEIVYKLVLKEHLSYKKAKTKEHLKITMTQVPFALSFAGYNFEYDLLSKIFGSEKHKGKRSVKVLRDLLNHTLNSGAIQELENRYDELNTYMDTFLNIIRNSTKT